MGIQKIRTRMVAAVLAVSFIGGAALTRVPDTAPTAIVPVSDTEAAQFVAANKKVAQVASSMTAELKAAPSDAAAAEVQAKAEQQMVAAIQAEGITPKRYTEIVRLAETDEATLAKLHAEFDG